MAGGARAIYALGFFIVSLFLFYEVIIQTTFLSKINSLSEGSNVVVSLIDNLVSNLIWSFFIISFILIAISIGLLGKGKVVKIAAILAIIFLTFLGLILPASLLPFTIFGILGLLFIYRKTFEHNFFEGMKILLAKNS